MIKHTFAIALGFPAVSSRASLKGLLGSIPIRKLGVLQREHQSSSSARRKLCCNGSNRYAPAGEPPRSHPAGRFRIGAGWARRTGSAARRSGRSFVAQIVVPLSRTFLRRQRSRTRMPALVSYTCWPRPGPAVNRARPGKLPGGPCTIAAGGCQGFVRSPFRSAAAEGARAWRLPGPPGNRRSRRRARGPPLGKS